MSEVEALARPGVQVNLTSDFGKVTWNGDEPIVLQPAARHGVKAEDALHAWAFALDTYDVGAGMIMYIGPDRVGDLLEVGVVQWHEDLAIVHAMPARDKFVR